MAEQDTGDRARNLGIVSQLARFVVIGGACALVDSGTYAVLLSFTWPLWLAKSVSFIIGTTASYFINRKFTFRSAGTGNTKAKASGFALVYTVTFFVNVGTNQLVNIVTQNFDTTLQTQHAIGWVIAQGVSTMINFVMLKWVVFRDS